MKVKIGYNNYISKLSKGDFISYPYKKKSPEFSRLLTLLFANHNFFCFEFPSAVERNEVGSSGQSVPIHRNGE